MKLERTTIARLAEHLENCELHAQDTLKITDEHPEMDWDDAYAIQDEIRRRKLARGGKIVGLKAGLTSHAKMKQMGVESPVFGFMAVSKSNKNTPEARDGSRKLVIRVSIPPASTRLLAQATISASSMGVPLPLRLVRILIV